MHIPSCFANCCIVRAMFYDVSHLLELLLPCDSSLYLMQAWLNYMQSYAHFESQGTRCYHNSVSVLSMIVLCNVHTCYFKSIFSEGKALREPM